jgi:hypothetical protein
MNEKNGKNNGEQEGKIDILTILGLGGLTQEQGEKVVSAYETYNKDTADPENRAKLSLVVRVMRALLNLK